MAPVGEEGQQDKHENNNEEVDPNHEDLGNEKLTMCAYADAASIFHDSIRYDTQKLQGLTEGSMLELACLDGRFCSVQFCLSPSENR